MKNRLQLTISRLSRGIHVYFSSAAVLIKLVVVVECIEQRKSSLWISSREIISSIRTVARSYRAQSAVSSHGWHTDDFNVVCYPYGQALHTNSQHETILPSVQHKTVPEEIDKFSSTGALR
jgi:hypothetical protein